MCEAELARGRGQMMRWESREEEDSVGPLGPREQAVVPGSILRHTTKPHSVPVLQNSGKALWESDIWRRRVLMELSGFNIPCPWILTISCDIIINPILWLGNWLRDDKFLIQHCTTYTCQFGSEFINQNFFPNSLNIIALLPENMNWDLCTFWKYYFK